MGLLLAAGVVGWSYLGAAPPHRSPAAFTLLLAASASAFAIGRLVGSVYRLLIPSAVVASAAILAIATPDVLSSAPLSGPFGYSNAKGAFYLQAAISGLMMATASRRPLARFVGLIAASAFATVPFLVESITPAVLVFVLPLAALAARTPTAARATVLVNGLMFILVLFMTIAIGFAYTAERRTGPVDRLVDSTLTERRAALWHESLVIMGEYPVRGVGLGGFQVLSPTARSDPDARWAHNSFLQQGAETGLVGLILLVLLFAWGFVGLHVRAAHVPSSSLGAVALAALAIHACVDYILHFPAVPLASAALVGAAGAQPKTRSEHR